MHSSVVAKTKPSGVHESKNQTQEDSPFGCIGVMTVNPPPGQKGQRYAIPPGTSLLGPSVRSSERSARGHRPAVA